MAENSDKQLVNDVAKPGSTPPDASGKPVIVSHKPMLKDPMVNEEEEKPIEEGLHKSAKTTIKPVHDDIATEKNETEEADQVEESTEDEVAGPKDTDSDSLEDESVKPKKKTKEESNEDDEKIRKLVESKKYFVKVRAPKRKRNKRTIIVLLFVLLLGLVGFAAAADAELIPVKVPFDFIKVKQPESSVVVVASTTQKPEQANTPATQKTSDVKTFESKELGLSFDYPSSAGMQPAVSKTDSLFAKSGTAYNLLLKQKLAGFAFASDWQPADNIAETGKYNDCASIDKTTKVTVAFSAGENYCVKGYDYVDYTSDKAGVPAAVVTMQKKITTPTGIVFVNVTSAPVGSSNKTAFTEASLKAALSATAAELDTVAKSMKPLSQ